MCIGIQALYGTNGMTLPPPSAAAPTRRTPVIPEGAPDICQDVKFDAIFHHVVDGILKTFAFYDEYYMEIKDFSIISVSTSSNSKRRTSSMLLTSNVQKRTVYVNDKVKSLRN